MVIRRCPVSGELLANTTLLNCVDCVKQCAASKIPKHTDKCFWCGKEVPHADLHHFVHLGGHGEVCGCDDCLGLAPAGKVAYVSLVCSRCGQGILERIDADNPGQELRRHLLQIHGIMEASHA